MGLNANFTHKNQEVGNGFSVNLLFINDLGNKFSLNRNNLNLGLEYLFKNKNFTISLIGDFVNVATQFYSNVKDSKIQNQILLPTAKIEYKNRKLGTFNLDYQKSIKDIFAHYYYVGNYLISSTYLFKGIENLENPISEKILFRYNKKSSYYGYDIDIKYNFTNKLKDYIADTETTSLQKTNTIYFTENVGKRNGVEWKLEKQILNKKISLISHNSLDFEKQLVKINGVESWSETDSKNFNFSVKSRFKGNYNFEIYNNYNIIKYKNTLTENLYKINETGISLNFNPTEKWTFTADLSFNKDIENNINYSKSTIKIDYFMNSNLYFNLFANNIFGSYRKITMNNEDVFSYYQQENLMPRFFYAGLTYKF